MSWHHRLSGTWGTFVLLSKLSAEAKQASGDVAVSADERHISAPPGGRAAGLTRDTRGSRPFDRRQTPPQH